MTFLPKSQKKLFEKIDRFYCPILKKVFLIMIIELLLFSSFIYLLTSNEGIILLFNYRVQSLN